MVTNVGYTKNSFTTSGLLDMSPEKIVGLENRCNFSGPVNQNDLGSNNFSEILQYFGNVLGLN